MSAEDNAESGGANPQELFVTTHWSVVLSAGNPNSPKAAAALAELCQTYWYPLYVFARRHGNGHDDAMDLTQSFFEKLLTGNAISTADRNRGRFRNFLLAAFKNFTANEWKRSKRLKRGGGADLISLDEETADERYRHEPVDTAATPDEEYDRNWAVVLLERALAKLEEEYPAKKDMFTALKIFLMQDGSEKEYAKSGERRGMSTAAVKMQVSRMRKRFREVLCSEVAHTVSKAEDVDQELQELLERWGF